MNNKCGCQQGFVPVYGNWDFNMDGNGQLGSGCRPGAGDARQRQNRCNACEAAETACKHAARADDAGRAVCEKNAESRRMDCACERAERREEICGVCGRGLSACICRQKSCDRTEYDACPAQGNTPACVMKAAEAPRGYMQKGVGIVRATKQALNDIYDNARALKAGTLFPELHKPMTGYCPCGEMCGDDCQQAAFAAWEVRLYLDTHPDDVQARALLNQLIGDCCEPNYATTFLPEECARWAWTDDPWPWNIGANQCK